MVSARSVEDQLKRIGFSARTWNRAECVELASILIPGEQIFECVNGWYEGGFALLCATNTRILLVDKKPLRFLTVEDLRFNMINQIDYSHRMLDANIHVSTGMKVLRFRSYNQPRLRKLISHVQHSMAELKTEHSHDTQGEQVPKSDQQLQSYWMAQYQQNQAMRNEIANTGNVFVNQAAPLNSSVPVSDNITAEEVWRDGLIKQVPTQVYTNNQNYDPMAESNGGITARELYDDGLKEILGARPNSVVPMQQQNIPTDLALNNNHFEINPLKIAYSKLPLLLRSRQYARMSLNRAM